MNEITKLYENAGVKKIYDCYTCPYNDCEDKCKVNMETNYPYFTEEKQLELIKWLANRGSCELIIQGHPKANLYKIGTNFINRTIEFSFEETLAELINEMWQDLTEEEKQQIKEILE